MPVCEHLFPDQFQVLHVADRLHDGVGQAGFDQRFLGVQFEPVVADRAPQRVHDGVIDETGQPVGLGRLDEPAGYLHLAGVHWRADVDDLVAGCHRGVDGGSLLHVADGVRRGSEFLQGWPLAFVAYEHLDIGARCRERLEDSAAGTAVCCGQQGGHASAARSGPCAFLPPRTLPRRRPPPCRAARGCLRCRAAGRGWCVFPGTWSWGRSAGRPPAAAPLPPCA